MKKGILITVLIGLSLCGLTGCGKEEKLIDNDRETSFSVSYQNINILPGTEFKRNAFNDQPEYSEIESCAFEGLDKVYTYDDVEITTANINGKETIYSVYFLSENITTTEGIKLSDEKAKMIEKYGNNYDNFGNQYSYTKGIVKLAFIIENDIINSIEYTYIVDIDY